MKQENTILQPVRSLGERESYLLNRMATTGRRIFTVEDVRLLVNGEGAGDVPRLLRRLAGKRWLQRIERGKYRIIPLEAGPEAVWAEHEFLTASTLIKPYYLAYGTALSYYGYSDRPLNPVWIATTNRRRPAMIEGLEYRFVTLKAHKFFGFSTVMLLDHPVEIARREKAIVDGFDHPEYCGSALEVAKALWFGSDELDLALLVSYGQRLGNRAVLRRLGFWLETLGAGEPAILAQLQANRDRNYALLDPSGPSTGVRNARWRLIVNVPDGQLVEWQEH